MTKRELIELLNFMDVSDDMNVNIELRFDVDIEADDIRYIDIEGMKVKDDKDISLIVKPIVNDIPELVKRECHIERIRRLKLVLPKMKRIRNRLKGEDKLVIFKALYAYKEAAKNFNKINDRKHILPETVFFDWLCKFIESV